MAVRILSKQEKWDVVKGFKEFKMSIKVLANQYNCSTATISRVLKEYLPKDSKPTKQPAINSEEAKKVMSLLYRWGVSADQLESILSAPALCAGNVVKFLRDSNPAQLAIVLHAAGLAETLPVLPTKPIPKTAQQPLFEDPE